MEKVPTPAAAGSLSISTAGAGGGGGGEPGTSKGTADCAAAGGGGPGASEAVTPQLQQQMQVPPSPLGPPLGDPSGSILFAFWVRDAVSVRVKVNFNIEVINLVKDGDSDFYAAEVRLPRGFVGDVTYVYLCDDKVQEPSPSSVAACGMLNILEAAKFTGAGVVAAGDVAVAVLMERAEAVERAKALQDIHAAVEAWGNALATRFQAARVAHMNERVTRAFAPAHNAANLACNYMLDVINICARVHGAAPPCEDSLG